MVCCTDQAKQPTPRVDYLAKEEKQSKPDAMKLYNSKACIVCHSMDGSKTIGPTFKGLYGSEVTLDGGKKVIADEKYLRESILEPNAKVRKGYPAVMPKPSLSEEEVNALIALIKSLSSTEKVTQK
jgi:cytochrome c oxidase subunit 2